MSSTWIEKLRLEINYYDGLCPRCIDEGNFAASQPMLANVRKHHYAYCAKHRVYWYVGRNVYSGWQYEDASTWKENLRMLRGMTVVKCRFGFDEEESA